MTTPPQIGFGGLSGRTWTSSDIHTAARWRSDMTILGYLFAGKCRPMLLSSNNDGQALSNGSNVLLFIGPNVPLNTWNVPVQNSNVPSNIATYQIPMAGVYLMQCTATLNTAGTPQNFKYAVGFSYVQNGAGTATTDGGSSPATNSTSVSVGAAGCELIWFNTFVGTADTVAMYAFTNNSSPGTVRLAEFMVEWVGLPLVGTTVTGYAGAYGTRVNSPQLAAAPPSGQGTTLAFATGGGQTVITVNDPTGIVTGSVIGLDYINGQANNLVAEAVTVSAVNGAKVTISAALYPHVAGAPVMVPLSAAFMNQQVRDLVNFLYYPPMTRAISNATQSIPSQVFSAGTQITTLGTNNIDNFNGFASNAYTVPVAGVYLVYGQVYFAGTTSGFRCAAGITINGGTVQWGERIESTSTSTRTTCPTFRRLLRFNAGDVIRLFGSQDSGGAMNTVSSGSAFSKIICLWRSV